MSALSVVQIVLLGLLAGEEVIVCWGIQPTLTSLPDDAHVRARIALVKRLKVVVPVKMVPTILVSIALLVVAGGADGFAWRIAGIAALLIFVLVSFLGTVPINMAVNDWNPTQPPANWRDVVVRWQRLDILRSTAATLAFVLFAIAIVVQLGNPMTVLADKPSYCSSLHEI